MNQQQIVMSEITFPRELGESHLSLSEIGAIFVLYSLNTINEDAQAYWSTDDAMIETGQQLTDRGILKFSKNDDDESIMEIDLTGVKPIKKNFWEVWDVDYDGNKILYHWSNIGDDDSRYIYELRPKLFENSIVWSLYFDSVEIREYFPIYSLDEGERILREILENEKKSNRS